MKQQLQYILHSRLQFGSSIAPITWYRVILFLEFHRKAHLEIIPTAQVEFYILQSYNSSNISKGVRPIVRLSTMMETWFAPYQQLYHINAQSHFHMALDRTVGPTPFDMILELNDWRGWNSTWAVWVISKWAPQWSSIKSIIRYLVIGATDGVSTVTLWISVFCNSTMNSFRIKYMANGPYRI